MSKTKNLQRLAVGLFALPIVFGMVSAVATASFAFLTLDRITILWRKSRKRSTLPAIAEKHPVFHSVPYKKEPEPVRMITIERNRRPMPAQDAEAVGDYPVFGQGDDGWKPLPDPSYGHHPEGRPRPKLLNFAVSDARYQAWVENQPHTPPMIINPKKWDPSDPAFKTIRWNCISR